MVAGGRRTCVTGTPDVRRCPVLGRNVRTLAAGGMAEDTPAPCGSAQRGTVGAKPLARRPVLRIRAGHQPPVRGRMVHPFEVHEFVDEHVVPHPGMHQDQMPIQADVAIAAARPPPQPLIAHADTRHRQAVPGGQLDEARRKLANGPVTQGEALRRRGSSPREAGTLPRDPLRIRTRELVCGAPGSAARNGHAQTAVSVHPQHVAPCAAMPHVIGRRDCDYACRCDGRVERKAQLHP